MYYIKFPTVRFMDLVGSNLQRRMVFEGLKIWIGLGRRDQAVIFGWMEVS